MITPSFQDSKITFSFCFCALLWSPVSRSSSHYRPPDSCMCGIISKLFPFPSPPATNLLPSSPLTTREMSSHCRLSEGKDWPWRQVPPLKRRLHQIFLQHTCFQKSIFPPLMVLYLSGSYSTTQDTQIRVKFTVRQHKHFFISLSMHGFMNMNIQTFIWIFTKYHSVSQPLLFSSFFSRTHYNHMHKQRRAGCLLLEFSNNYNQLFQQRSAAVPSMHQHLVFATLYVLGVEMTLFISAVLISFCSDCRWAVKFSCQRKQIF